MTLMASHISWETLRAEVAKVQPDSYDERDTCRALHAGTHLHAP